VFTLLVLVYDIIKPFVGPLVWGGIIAIAAFPLTQRIEGWLGGRRGLAATLVSLFFIAILVVPCYQLTAALIKQVGALTVQINEGTLQMPAPTPSVKEWPLVGDKIYLAWSEAHENLQETVKNAAPHLSSLAATVAKALGGGLAGVLVFCLSLLIAAGFMTYAGPSGVAAHRLFVRLGGVSPGGEWASLCVATVRSVLQGVVGVALIQAALCGIGLWIMGIPGAAVWSTLILLLAIAQLPTIIVAGPIMVYAFSAYEITPAIIFSVWMFFAGFSDTFLKPLLMGRGLDIPMPIILIGAIGGMVASGIIGLFTGAVVLSIFYRLFYIWMEQDAI
jgi:predicted PurR-regulated permease PerM